MPNPVALLLETVNGEKRYSMLWFWCPGCERVDPDGSRHGGLHALPVNTDQASVSWEFNGDLLKPTVKPSILTKRGRAEEKFVCHSFLTDGVFRFLSDSTHKYKNMHVELPPLPDWVVKDVEDRNEKSL